MFRDGTVKDVVIRPAARHSDERGWLMELFRADGVSPEHMPVMAYVSMTRPGVVRGPHEHLDQADCFCFFGPSDFKVYLWDNRALSPTYMVRQVVEAGESAPSIIIVPKKVVHAYRNTGNRDGLVINCPNRLFKGHGRIDPVDEVRYEDVLDSPFRMD